MFYIQFLFHPENLNIFCTLWICCCSDTAPHLPIWRIMALSPSPTAQLPFPPISYIILLFICLWLLLITNCGKIYDKIMVKSKHCQLCLYNVPTNDDYDDDVCSPLSTINIVDIVDYDNTIYSLMMITIMMFLVRWAQATGQFSDLCLPHPQAEMARSPGLDCHRHRPHFHQCIMYLFRAEMANFPGSKHWFQGWGGSSTGREGWGCRWGRKRRR